MFKNRITFSPGMLLSPQEAAALIPTPPKRVLEDSTYPIRSGSRTKPVPRATSEDGVRIGLNIHRGVRQAARLSDDLRNRHVYTLGKTRMGKSTLMLNMCMQDIKRGKGATVLDTEGDLIEAILERIPLWRLDDLVYFDVGDDEYAPAFNYLNSAEERSRARRRDHFTETFERAVSPVGDRSRMLLDRALDALLEVEGSSLIDIEPFLRDAAFRRVVLSQVRDPMTRRYWLQEFTAREQQLGTSVEALSSRLHYLTGDRTFRDCICQRQSRIDIADILKRRKIFLVNLNFKQIGRRKGALMGQLMMFELQVAGMSRQDADRIDHYVYADEFQNYLCSATELLLSQGAKYRMNLCLAHQYIGQVGDLAKAILGNVGACVVYRLGPADAQILANDFGTIAREEFTALPKYHAWVKAGDSIFSLVGDPPQSPEQSHAWEAVQRSRQSYSTKRDEISYDPPFMPGYWASASEDGLPGRGFISIDESFDEL